MLSRSGERAPTQNFLEIPTEASAPQSIEIALKPRNNGEMKSLEGLNPRLSAAQSQVSRILRAVIRAIEWFEGERNRSVPTRTVTTIPKSPRRTLS